MGNPFKLFKGDANTVAGQAHILPRPTRHGNDTTTLEK
jgi:hypothetical protein